MDVSRRNVGFDDRNVGPDDRTLSLDRRDPARDGREAGLYGSEGTSAIEPGNSDRTWQRGDRDVDPEAPDDGVGGGAT